MRVLSVLAASGGAPCDTANLGLRRRYMLGRIMLEDDAHNDLRGAALPCLPWRHAEQRCQRAYRIPHEGKGEDAMMPMPRMAPGHMCTNVSIWCRAANDMLDGMIRCGGAEGGGWQKVASKGQDLREWQYVGGEEERRMLWEHTVEAMGV